MALDVFISADVIRLLENFLVKRRPPENIRHKLDVDYRIENQSVIIFERRPQWNNKAVYIESPTAKATWVKSKRVWKIFWMRADLKWHGYPIPPVVSSFSEFLKIVDEDKAGCFWG